MRDTVTMEKEAREGKPGLDPRGSCLLAQAAFCVIPMTLQINSLIT